MLRIKKAVRIITLNRYNSHAEPLFKTHQILKIGEQLQVQEHKFFYKYMHVFFASLLIQLEGYLQL